MNDANKGDDFTKDRSGRIARDWKDDAKYKENTV